MRTLDDELPYPWFERGTYARARELMFDGEYWPADYEIWQGLASNAISRLSMQGVVALRQPIDPENFLNWCHSQDRPADSDSRLTYASIQWQGAAADDR